jgi:hypothetical protein
MGLTGAVRAMAMARKRAMVSNEDDNHVDGDNAAKDEDHDDNGVKDGDNHDNADNKDEDKDDENGDGDGDNDEDDDNDER